MSTPQRKSFELLGSGHKISPVFHAATPRQAAMKAASRGYTDIHLREKGTAKGKVHHFDGTIQMLDEPETIYRHGQEVTYETKAHVMKRGTYFLKDGRKSARKSPKSPRKSPRTQRRSAPKRTRKSAPKW